MIADPGKPAPYPAFDAKALAAALSAAGGRPVTVATLNVTDYAPEGNGGFVVTVRGGKFHCNAAGDKCTADAAKPGAAAPARGRGSVAMSPDGKLGAYIKNDNLWVKDMAAGTERQLTTDGVKDYGYATDNAGWSHSDSAILVWSADSKKIATFQQDQRKTGTMYLVPVTYRHPALEAWKYPLVGDKDVTMIERVVIDVPTATVVRLKMPPDEHRSTTCDNIACRGGAWDDVQFAPDGKTLAFVSSSRDHKDAWLRVADTSTGVVREVYHEHVPTYYESGAGRVNWKYLPESNEFLWFSERTDFGQMYLYDLTTGKLKNAITHGDGPLTQVLYVDTKARVIYFLAAGKEKGEDPYFDHYYRADFDGKNQKLLSPENADHAITPAPDGKTFVDVYSTVQTPQTVVLRDNTGKVLTTLAKQDISELLAAGWKPPTPITVKARDGKTDLYGFLWKPTTFDASKKYPIINYIYPGPQSGSCRGRGFAPAQGDDQALSELGFIVVCIDAMGTPHRSKSFHDAHADTPDDMGEDTMPDQVAGMKELAAKYPWIDIDKVGIWGHSGGGNATVSALFHYPDFFKVGWSESGNHDQRDYEDDWDEKWAGLETISADGKDNYAAQANEGYAKNLKGKLMLTHGTMDDNVPPNNTLLVVDALIKANKDFDLIMVPNVHHGYAEDGPYIMRRRWDYFVKNLAGGVPPVGYELTSTEAANRRAGAAGGPEDDEDSE
jgi:dipeptidyl aminopeptidase/acylaminoacyl peptidase